MGKDKPLKKPRRIIIRIFIGISVLAALILIANAVLFWDMLSAFSNNEISHPAWSADSKELYFLHMEDKEPGKYGPVEYWPKAIDVKTKITRTLTKKPITGFNTGGYAVQLSRDGNTLYFSVPGDDRIIYYLYSVAVSGGDPRLLIKDLDFPQFAVSDDEQLISYPRAQKLSTIPDNKIIVALPPDLNLIVMNMTTNQEDLVPDAYGVAEPFSFSPDNKTLLWGRFAERGIPQLYSLTEKTNIPLFHNAPDNGVTLGKVIAPEVRWKQGMPELLMSYQKYGTQKVGIFSSITGEVTDITTLPEGKSSAALLSWLPEQEKIASWIPIEVVSSNIERTTNRWKLFILQPDGKWKVVTERKADESLRWLAFSPNGKQIGYELYSSLYLKGVQ